MSSLPIDPLIPRLLNALGERRAAVVVAPPGAGKTTRIPPALLDAGLTRGGNVVLVQPRRVAVRAAARRIAFERGSDLGREVGYQVRFDRVASDATRLLVVTEGILTRRLQDDPFLEGVAAVVLDEFHERSLQSDLLLALLRELQRSAREDLTVVVMSATLEAEPVGSFLDAPVLRAEGRSFPVDVIWSDQPDTRPVAERAATGVRRAVLESPTGDVLVFLPGAGDIRRVASILSSFAEEKGLLVLPLHGDLGSDAQDRALLPSRERKVILATNVAETSLTIEGVSIVVDTGLMKQLVHDPRLGIDRLEIVSISRASAEQRAGRAGRTGPGRVYRLWTRAEHRSLLERNVPEIRRVDLSSAVLELKAWGVSDLETFGWFETPERPDIERALTLLEILGALSAQGVVTARGQALLALPLPPRLGCLLLEARARGVGSDGAVLAALCAERDILLSGRAFGSEEASSVGDSDLLLRLDRYREAERERFLNVHRFGLDAAATRQVARVVRALRPPRTKSPEALDEARHRDRLLQATLAAYPDRVARRRSAKSQDAVMVGGRGLSFGNESIVREAPYFVAVDLDGGRRGIGSVSRVRKASAFDASWLEELFPGSVTDGARVTFDPAQERVLVRQERRFRDLVLDEREGGMADPREVEDVLREAFRSDPDRVLPKDGPARDWMVRVRCLAAWLPDAGLPRWTRDELIDVVSELCVGCRSFADLRRRPLLDVLKGLSHATHLRLVEQEAPERWVLPTGRQAPLTYEEGCPPVLSAKVQELFGLRETPRVARNRVPCVVEILGPNYRPVQRTQDLASFWLNTYPQVRKDLRGRYPKHSWPETPP